MKPLRSRQRLEQIRNLENGMCQFHKNRPKWESDTYCKECLEKYRQRHGVKKPHPTREKWATVDWSLPEVEIAESLGVTIGAVQYQWNKIVK